MDSLNIPNKITMFRIFIIPLFVVLLISDSREGSMAAAVLFSIAALSDWLDGYLARTLNQVTTLGKLLDPIADKILVTSALIPLVELDRVAAWIAVVIIGREIAMSGFRTITAAQGIIIEASNLGKYKTALEIGAILFLILDFHIYSIPFKSIGTVLIWAAMIFSIISAVDYFMKFRKNIQTGTLT